MPELRISVTDEFLARLDTLGDYFALSSRRDVICYLITSAHERYTRPADWPQLQAKAALHINAQRQALHKDRALIEVLPHEIDRIQETQQGIRIWTRFDSQPFLIPRADWDAY